MRAGEGGLGGGGEVLTQGLGFRDYREYPLPDRPMLSRS